MTLIADQDLLTQGLSSSVAATTFASAGVGAANRVVITSVNVPAQDNGDFLEVRDAVETVNNGLYSVISSVGGTSITAEKVIGSNPIDDAGSVAIRILGDNTVASALPETSGSKKNIHYDVASKQIALLELGQLGADGVLSGQVYSNIKTDWKDDPDLIKNRFPLDVIDVDAGKYLLGTDGAVNNGWNFVDVPAYSVRTRKLLRNGGWSELSDAGVLQAEWSGIRTLGDFEDAATDNAYYQFGNDTTVDDTVDFDFAGPVNEAIQVFERLADGTINGGTGIAINTAGTTLTRSDGGDWSTEGVLSGFKVGGKIALRDCEEAANDGTFLISAVGAGVDGAITVGTGADAVTGFDFVDGGGGDDSITRADGGDWIDEGYFVGGVVVVSNATTVANDGTYTITTITATAIGVATASLTADTGDQTATFGPIEDLGTPDTVMNAAIDNRNALSVKIRVRDADPNGKTFGSANLASAGETVLSNRLFSFPLSNVTDLKIIETDANIIANLPYTGMSITYFATPQSKSGFIGGSFNFGIVVDANGGTAIEVYEFVQHELRLLTDIDADADTAIGRAMDDLLVFEGDVLIAGKSTPRNPDGGGSGVAIDNIAAADQNNLRMFDNLGDQKQFPETISITLDFNQIIIDDTLAEYTLFFDRTIRTNVTDFVLTAGTGADGTITSAGTNMPNNAELSAGDYIRVASLAGADEPMNGIYQITTETTPGAAWDVTRYDGATIVTVTTVAADIDQNPIDSPDAIIVKSDAPADVTGLANADFNFAFDFDANVQGGRPISTPTFVVARVIGSVSPGAKYVESTVQTISTGTPLTITLTGGNERNATNP